MQLSLTKAQGNKMTAGSALFYLGSALHGDGPNTTEDMCHHGMFLDYLVGWLRAEENTFLTVPMKAAKAMPVRLQECSATSRILASASSMLVARWSC